MAVFLVRMETDFAEQYDLFYNSVREGDTLQNIQYRKSQMIYTARQGIYEIFKVQGITVVLLLLWGKDILNAFGISSLYAPLLYIDIVGVGMQVLFLSILNVLFYLDDRKTSLTVLIWAPRFLVMASHYPPALSAYLAFTCYQGYWKTLNTEPLCCIEPDDIGSFSEPMFSSY